MSKGDLMQVAVRPFMNAGVALMGASVIAAAPITAQPTHIEVPKVVSAAVDLVASVNPIEAYGQLLSNTINNTGALANQAFSSGLAPLLQQFIVNQLTLAQGLNTAFNEVFSSSNPSGLPAILQTALTQLSHGQVQAAAETISSGVIQVAFPFLTPLLQPLNNLVAVVNQIPNIVVMAGIGVISPPMALLQSAGAAVQSMINALSAGDVAGFVGAIVSAPAVMLDGFINGYAPTFTGGLLTPDSGTLSILVNIRNMIVAAITPTTTLAAPQVAAAKTAVGETATAEKTTAQTQTTEAAPATDAKTTETTETTGATETTATGGTPSTASAEATGTEVKTDTPKADPAKADDVKTAPSAGTDAQANSQTTKTGTDTGKSGSDKTDTTKTDTTKTGTAKTGTDASADTTKVGTTKAGTTNAGSDSKPGSSGSDGKSGGSGSE
jgi:hypothetical protein